jgi:hypothetical protein
MLCIIDEFTREGLTIRVARKLNATDVIKFWFGDTLVKQPDRKLDQYLPNPRFEVRLLLGPRRSAVLALGASAASRNSD